MRNPYLSIFSTHDLPSKTKELENLWDMYVVKCREEAILDKIRESVLHSWRRCHHAGVDPAQLRTKQILTDQELNHLLKTSEIYRVAKPIIDELFHKMSETGHLITLSDQNGRIIYLKGDPPTIRSAEKMNFAAGMDWSESTAGTNAIGTSIVTKVPIQIFSAEHFCHGCHPWSCSSAPIFHPVTQEIIGTIDFTGIWTHAQPHTLGLAVSIAQLIETKLAESYLEKTCHLVETFFRSADKWKTDHVLVLNRDFFVVKSSEKLAHFFKLSPASKLSNHPDFQSLIKDYIHASQDSSSNPVANACLIQNFLVIDIEPIYFHKALAGYLIVLKDADAGRTSESPSEIAAQAGPWAEVIGHSKSFAAAINKCRKTASSNVPIIVLGESGTGKEKIARTIHRSSNKHRKPFLAINCGAIPKELVSSELFGYERGTFTGGMAGGKKGIFEEANGGTLFLDEIGEMPLDSQIHLLRVLQEREVTRLGSSQPIPVDVRIIAATNKNLLALCKNGGFRKDLFYRLNVVSVTIPPLRERKDDIIPITNYFLKQFVEKYEKNSLSISDHALSFFLEYSWPGNIRELQNVLEHAVIFSESSFIKMEHLPSYLIENGNHLSTNDAVANMSPLDAEEKKILLQLLEESGWNISAVAKKLNIARSTLYRKLKKYRLRLK